MDAWKVLERDIKNGLACESNIKDAARIRDDFWDVISDVESIHKAGQTGWFPAFNIPLPVAYTLDVSNPKPKYNSRRLVLKSTDNLDDEGRDIFRGIQVAVSECFRSIYTTRKELHLVDDNVTLIKFMKDAQSTPVSYDPTTETFQLVAVKKNVSAFNDINILTFHENDPLDGDGKWAKPEVKVRLLPKNSRVQVGGNLRAYDLGGSKYGVSFYLSDDILFHSSKCACDDCAFK